MVVLAGSLGVMALLVGAGWIHWLASHRRISPLWWTAACTLAIGLAFLAWGRGYSEEISRQRKPEGWCDSCERLRELEVANRWGGGRSRHRFGGRICDDCLVALAQPS